MCSGDGSQSPALHESRGPSASAGRYSQGRLERITSLFGPTDREPVEWMLAIVTALRLPHYTSR